MEARYRAALSPQCSTCPEGRAKRIVLHQIGLNRSLASAGFAPVSIAALQNAGDAIPDATGATLICPIAFRTDTTSTTHAARLRHVYHLFRIVAYASGSPKSTRLYDLICTFVNEPLLKCKDTLVSRFKLAGIR